MAASSETCSDAAGHSGKGSHPCRPLAAFSPTQAKPVTNPSRVRKRPPDEHVTPHWSESVVRDNDRLGITLYAFHLELAWPQIVSETSCEP